MAIVAVLLVGASLFDDAKAAVNVTLSSFVLEEVASVAAAAVDCSFLLLARRVSSAIASSISITGKVGFEATSTLLVAAVVADAPSLS